MEFCEILTHTAVDIRQFRQWCGVYCLVQLHFNSKLVPQFHKMLLTTPKASPRRHNFWSSLPPWPGKSVLRPSKPRIKSRILKFLLLGLVCPVVAPSCGPQSAPYTHSN